MRFRATIELAGKTATGIEVPAEVVAGLGSSKRPAVHVTLREYTYRSTIASMGGRYLIPVSAEIRTAAARTPVTHGPVSEFHVIPARFLV